ncbi:MAG: LysR family transcriptional regulator substrate-binding protein, partial [Gemmataceae bacterium]
LIDRSHRPLQLTPLGQAYHEGCKRLLEQYLELESSLRKAPPSLIISINVAAIYSVGLGDMGQFVERFEKQHPHLKVHVEYLHPAQVIDRVTEGIADFGLLSYPRSTRDLIHLPWREEEMVVACPPDHPLAAAETVSLPTLARQRFVAFDRGLPIRREIDRFLRENAVAVEVVLEFANVENIKKGVEHGSGISLLPEPTIRRELQSGTLRAVRLEGCRLVRPLGILHRRKPAPGNAVMDFIHLLRGVPAFPSAPSLLEMPGVSPLPSILPGPLPEESLPS